MADAKSLKIYKNLRKSIIEEIIENINSLDLSKDEKKKFTNELTTLKTKNKKKSNRTLPNIPKSKQCTGICKNGEECRVAMCDKNLKLCWAHMNKEEREKYKKNKDKGITEV
nr:telomere-binding protein [Saccharomycopsis malanga]